MRTKFHRTVITLAAIAVLIAALPTFAHEGQTRAHAKIGEDVAEEMASAAQRFLATLNEEQKKVGHIAFENDERKKFFFVPDRFTADKKRGGLVFHQMTPQQRILAHGLLATGMSSKGYLQATTIMALEQVLHELENQNPIRDPQLYYVTVFGQPGTDKTWGWKFEGHHLSINFTLVDGKKIAVTPSFFGSNPGVVGSGALQGTEVQKDARAIALELVQSLSEEQKSKAILSDTAPRDIITGQDRKVNKGAFLPVKGIAYQDLNQKQQRILNRLVKVFTNKYRGPIVHQIEHRTPIVDPESIHFAWAGSTEPGQGHYYRVQSSTFLFEYDNTQNGANHPHAVWRGFDGDFGDDLLAEHYEESHKE